MALIKCPECGGNVSDQAPVCIHCGYPLNQTVKVASYNASAPAITESGPYALVLYDVGPHRTKCDMEIMHANSVKAKQVTPLTEEVRKKGGQLTISVNDEEYNLMALKEKFDALQCGTKIVDMSSEEAMGYNYIACTLVTRRSSQQNIPKCPTCGSTHITKIGNLNRAASVAMFGGMSKKINKSFKCENCGYTW